MTPKIPPPPTAPMITLQDIYYTIFRHKWMIIILATITIVTAFVLRGRIPTLYMSQAKMMVKYVQNTKPLQGTGSDVQVIPMQMQEDSIISAEIEMLKSFDVALDAAAQVGPAKILARIDGGTNLTEAAFVIQGGLTVPDSRRNDVINIYFAHQDPAVVQPVLNALFRAYNTEHDTVRRPKIGDKLDEEIDDERTQIRATSEQLIKERQAAGIVSQADSAAAVGNQISVLEGKIVDIQGELAREREIVNQKKEMLAQLTGSVTNAVGTNTPPANVAAQYARLNYTLAILRNREQQLLSWATESAPEVQDIEAEIASKQTAAFQLETNYPALIATRPDSQADAHAITELRASIRQDTIAENGLLSQFSVLTNSLAKFETKAGIIAIHEAAMQDEEQDLQTRRLNLAAYQERREETKSSELVGPQNSSVSIVEAPTPPTPDDSRARKLFNTVLGVGLMLAFGLPFLIELYLDRSLKRPSDVQIRLNLPFFVSIPKVKLNGKRKSLKNTVVPLLTEGDGENDEDVAEETALVVRNEDENDDGTIAPWNSKHLLHPFFETLRDRLMTYFEMVNLTHKPKLVAVTSCNSSAGVTTTAAGLAASLSQTGEGNVLLVNMNKHEAQAHHFYKGKLACDLESALEKTTRDQAQVQGNLYVANDEEVNGNLPRVLPKRFSNLVNKMKASDYDYIIFDMPPISQISITPRLARYMDMVLLVVESGKTSRDVAKRAASVLVDSKTHVGVVLNKRKFYLPRFLEQEI